MSVRIGIASAAWTTAIPQVEPNRLRLAVILISGNIRIWNGTKAQMNIVKSSPFAHRTRQIAMA